MNKNKILERIGIDPNLMDGKPVIKGTRLTVEYILGLLTQGTTFDEVMEEYSGITTEDIQACLLFAIKSLEITEFMPLTIKAS